MKKYSFILGILLLFVTPIFLNVTTLLYAIIANTMTCLSLSLSHYMPLKLGTTLLNVLILVVSICTLKIIIKSAKNDLNRDLNSIKTYLIHCIIPIILNGLILGTIIYKPAFNWCCTILEWIFYTTIIILGLNFLAILTGVAHKSQI